MFQFDHVRTRFAPSPTGYMHVGNLRTALFAYLVAKSNNGRFLLRIEDTDQERQVEGAVEIIYKTLKETGLQWDEGPDIGGPVGPYIQSQRMGMFKKYAEQLVESGHAYYCFCDKEGKIFKITFLPFKSFREKEDKSVFTSSKSGATLPTCINSPISFTGCPLKFVVAIMHVYLKFTLYRKQLFPQRCSRKTFSKFNLLFLNEITLVFNLKYKMYGNCIQ